MVLRARSFINPEQHTKQRRNRCHLPATHQLLAQNPKAGPLTVQFKFTDGKETRDGTHFKTGAQGHMGIADRGRRAATVLAQGDSGASAARAVHGCAAEGAPHTVRKEARIARRLASSVSNICTAWDGQRCAPQHHNCIQITRHGWACWPSPVHTLPEAGLVSHRLTPYHSRTGTHQLVALTLGASSLPRRLRTGGGCMPLSPHHPGRLPQSRRVSFSSLDAVGCLPHPLRRLDKHRVNLARVHGDGGQVVHIGGGKLNLCGGGGEQGRGLRPRSRLGPEGCWRSSFHAVT